MVDREFHSRLEYDYIQFLASIIHMDKAPLNDNYWRLITELHKIPFEVLDPRDENRADDGAKLRLLYLDETGYNLQLEYPCSVLEFLIGVAIRMEDILEDPEYGDLTGARFHELLHNLRLDLCVDLDYCGRGIIHRQVNIMMNREYTRVGAGGLFPLRSARKDQRKVEIWYQMNAYLLENYYVDEE